MSESISLKDFRSMLERGEASLTRGKSKSGTRRMKLPAESSAVKKFKEEGKQATRSGKMNAKRVSINGIEFDSVGESQRYLFLKDMLRKGNISGLELQKKFQFELNGVLIGSYKADFVYTLTSTGKRVVEDFKGYKTKEYRRTKKMMLAFHDIEIFESVRTSLSELPS